MSGLELARARAAAQRIGLSQQTIAAFWLPLAASWAFMALESPITTGTLARLPDPALMIAAFGITMSLAITIESPIIMLLATSTALARDQQAYTILKRFTIGLSTAVTLVMAAVTWTPLYDVVVRQAIGAPPAIADAALPGLRIMLFWSAVIAWRRFKQGLIIRAGETRWVGYGTAVRLAATGITAVGLALWTALPGVSVGATALMAGVVAEAVFIQFAAQPIVARIPQAPAPGSQAGFSYVPLTYRAVVRYHMPLAATSLLLLLTQPLVGAALARTPQPELALAAWPLAHGLVFLFRSPGLALPEVTIALLGRPGAWEAVRRFCLTVGLSTAGVFALMGFTPLAHLYLSGLLGVAPELAQVAVTGIQMALLVPLLVAVQGWQRGRLMHLQFTPPITLAMGVHLITLAATLAVGVALGLPGVPLAGAALTIAMAVECGVLAWRSRGLVQPAA